MLIHLDQILQQQPVTYKWSCFWKSTLNMLLLHISPLNLLKLEACILSGGKYLALYRMVQRAIVLHNILKWFGNYNFSLPWLSTV